MKQKKIIFTALLNVFIVIITCGQSLSELKERAANGDNAIKLEVAKEYWKDISEFYKERKPGQYNFSIWDVEGEMSKIIKELIEQNYQPAIKFARENNYFKDYKEPALSFEEQADLAEKALRSWRTYAKKLTKTSFIEKVWDYKNSPKEWKFRGDNPALIDFYADWCGPCKRSSPILEKIAKEYKGKVDIYKVDTVVEKELASVFGIQKIPSFLYIPTKGKPTMASGIAKSKEDIEKMFRENIETLLLSEN